MKPFPVSIIISVYNKIDWLQLVLAGLERQSFKDFEVIIADDGSNKKFIDALNTYKDNSGLTIRHFWHEDKGFRKTRILNKCILASNSDYLIFIDGDCIPSKHFVADHWFNRQPDTVLAGRRTNLSPEITQQLTYDKILAGELENMAFIVKMWRSSIKHKIKHIEKSIRLPRFLYRMLPFQTKGILGCNFSIHKSTILEINGFDMRYEAPAYGEDSDIDLRLRWVGKRIKYLNFQAIQYHLYHKLLDREQANKTIYEEVLEAKQPITPSGIKQLQ